MRYLSLILFSGFLIFSIDFATQNTELVAFHYRLDWLNFSYQSERPVFVPVFFSFAFGIMFCVIYFFIYHAFLLKNLRQQKKEIKRLKSLVESEQEKHGSMNERNSELQQIVQRVQNRADGKPESELQALPEEEALKSSP
jgi:uncharacterized membrane protein YciS (DUF1049 family)